MHCARPGAGDVWIAKARNDAKRECGRAARVAVAVHAQVVRMTVAPAVVRLYRYRAPSVGRQSETHVHRDAIALASRPGLHAMRATGD